MKFLHIAAWVLTAAVFSACDGNVNGDDPSSATGSEAGSTVEDDVQVGSDGGGSDTETHLGNSTVDEGETDTTEPGMTDTGPVDTGSGMTMGDPIPDTPVGKWQRIPIEGAVCMDGSQAGFSIRRSGTSDDVLIYQQVGGACFNKAMCDVSDWGGAPFQKPSGMGIFDFDNAENPVRDYNMIFIPYCTGDVHSGSRPNAQVDGVKGEHQFVGGDNFRLYLKRIVPTFPNAKKIVFAGWSAGGFGTILNFVDLKKAFGEDVPVVVISDGGPPLRAEYFKPCLVEKLINTWELDEYVPDDCPDCLRSDAGGLATLLEYILKKYPDTVYGVDSAYKDAVIRMFMSYGLNNCQGTIGAQYPPEKYKEGLLDVKDHFSALDPEGDSFGTYFFSGQDHGRIDRATFYTQTADGQRLVDWFASMVAGKPYHVAQ